MRDVLFKREGREGKPRSQRKVKEVFFWGGGEGIPAFVPAAFDFLRTHFRRAGVRAFPRRRRGRLRPQAREICGRFFTRARKRRKTTDKHRRTRIFFREHERGNTQIAHKNIPQNSRRSAVYPRIRRISRIFSRTPSVFIRLEQILDADEADLNRLKSQNKLHVLFEKIRINAFNLIWNAVSSDTEIIFNHQFHQLIPVNENEFAIQRFLRTLDCLL